jgi:hypothetical protein
MASQWNNVAQTNLITEPFWVPDLTTQTLKAFL